jgi:alkylation response protein AidB-like acyl-CoA dehydrogenase
MLEHPIPACTATPEGQRIYGGANEVMKLLIARRL